MNITDSYFSYQWHLQATTSTGKDLNVLPVWDDYRGKGVTVGVIDTRIDGSHSDIAANWTAPYRLSVTGGAQPDPNPKAFGPEDKHGTAVAGIIAAAINGEGSVGVAPEASIASIPALSMSPTALVEALKAAASLDVVNSSWGFTSAFANSASSAYWSQFNGAIDHGIHAGRGGLGTVYVNAAGNDRTAGRETSDHQFSTHEGTIVVAAADINGTVTSYSTPGAAILVTAFGGDPSKGIATTDVSGSGGYTGSDQVTDFHGTSAAAPMVSGIVALMLEANPELGWRDVQDILASSARQLGSSTTNAAGDWNGGGRLFSNDTGFGLVDARAAVRMAEAHWALGLDAGTSENMTTITDFSLASVGGSRATIEFEIGDAVDVESAVVNLRLGTRDWSDIRITLVSPDGTISTLLAPGGATSGNLGPVSNWPLRSNAFRGEDAQGTWKMTIESVSGKSLGAMATATLEVHGQAETGDDVYVFTDDFAKVAGADRAALADSEGHDSIDASAVSGSIMLDLNPGALSQIAGRALQIDGHSVIEAAISGDGDDIIIGNAAANRLIGGRGDDKLLGGDGDDMFIDMAGSDTYAGGAGQDVLHFSFAFSDVEALVFDLATGTTAITRDGDTDIFSEIETVAFADRTFAAQTAAELQAQVAQAWGAIGAESVMMLSA